MAVGRQQNFGIRKNIEYTNEFSEVLSKGYIDPIQPDPCNLWRQTTVYECRAVDNSDDVLL